MLKIKRVLKTTSLILAYSSFLTPWLVQTSVPSIDITFHFVFADVVVWLGELPTNVSRIQIDSSLNYVILFLPLVFEMLFTWSSMGKFKEKPRKFEAAGAILGLVPVLLGLLQFFKVGFSSPQNMHVSLMPGFFFGLFAPLLVVASLVMEKAKT